MHIPTTKEKVNLRKAFSRNQLIERGSKKALEIIKREIERGKYNRSIEIAQIFAKKLEHLDPQSSLEFYLAISILYLHLEVEGKYLYTIGRIRQLIKNTFQLNVRELSDFLEQKFKQEYEAVMDKIYGKWVQIRILLLLSQYE